MNFRPIDLHAAKMPWMAGFLPCLYVPIAARESKSIETYVGKIQRYVSSPRSKHKALLVHAYDPEEPDTRLPIWDLPQAEVLHAPEQVWVHVDYSAYRRAYIRAFPDLDLDGLVIDHIMNRRVARLKCFRYYRPPQAHRTTSLSGHPYQSQLNSALKSFSKKLMAFTNISLDTILKPYKSFSELTAGFGGYV